MGADAPSAAARRRDFGPGNRTSEEPLRITRVSPAWIGSESFTLIDCCLPPTIRRIRRRLTALPLWARPRARELGVRWCPRDGVPPGFRTRPVTKTRVGSSRGTKTVSPSCRTTLRPSDPAVRLFPARAVHSKHLTLIGVFRQFRPEGCLGRTTPLPTPRHSRPWPALRSTSVLLSAGRPRGRNIAKHKHPSSSDLIERDGNTRL